MDIKVGELKLPEKIVFNYEELKNELTEKVKDYETIVYSDEQIKEAKKDKAELNKLKKALNDERIKKEREYMQPFADFKAKVNEIIEIIDKPIGIIDTQVKEYEELQKIKKFDSIKAYFDESVRSLGLEFNKIYNQKWVNQSVSMSKIKEEIDMIISDYKTNLNLLNNLPEYSFEAIETYVSTLDFQKSINKVNELIGLAKRKQEHEKKVLEEKELENKTDDVVGDIEIEVEEKPELENTPFIPSFSEVNEKKLVGFTAMMTEQEVDKLKEYFDNNKIEFKM